LAAGVGCGCWRCLRELALSTVRQWHHQYWIALWWVTITTFAGSVCAYFLAQGLIGTFSGKGLVSDSFLADPASLTAIVLGASITVFLAAKTGIPISTTHSLTGALKSRVNGMLDSI
jgi:phosphate/sulfate permease